MSACSVVHGKDCGQASAASGKDQQERAEQAFGRGPGYVGEHGGGSEKDKVAMIRCSAATPLAAGATVAVSGRPNAGLPTTAAAKIPDITCGRDRASVSHPVLLCRP